MPCKFDKFRDLAIVQAKQRTKLKAFSEDTMQNTVLGTAVPITVAALPC